VPFKRFSRYFVWTSHWLKPPTFLVLISTINQHDGKAKCISTLNIAFLNFVWKQIFENRQLGDGNFCHVFTLYLSYQSYNVMVHSATQKQVMQNISISHVFSVNQTVQPRRVYTFKMTSWRG
jgi:hypothetical protein